MHANSVFPVRPVETGATWMTPLRVIGTASTEAEAVALCEAEGFTVITVGGLVALSVDRVDDDGREHMAWTVTVEPS